MLENLSHDREKIQRARERVSLIINNCWSQILFALGKFSVHAEIIQHIDQFYINHLLLWDIIIFSEAFEKCVVLGQFCKASSTGSHTEVTKSAARGKLSVPNIFLSFEGSDIHCSDFLDCLWNKSSIMTELIELCSLLLQMLAMASLGNSVGKNR